MPLHEQLIAAFRAWDGHTMALAARGMVETLLERRIGSDEMVELDWRFRELLEGAEWHQNIALSCNVGETRFLLGARGQWQGERLVALGFQFSPAFNQGEDLLSRWHALGFNQEHTFVPRGELSIPPLEGEPGHGSERSPSIHVLTQTGIAAEHTWAAGCALANGRGPWLARYLAGERETVWNEMLALGSRVREPSVFGDAIDVALETMRRARAGIALLHARLKVDGHDFMRPDEAFVPPSGDEAQAIAELERRVGALPLSLCAFYTVVGSVNFCGEHPGWELPGEAILDPLVVDSPAWVLEYSEDRWRRLQYQLAFAPDRFHKEDISGGAPYALILPDSAVDGTVFFESTQPTFVSLLRRSLAFGGFPGWSSVPEAERPHAVIAQLTNGLADI